MNRGMFACRPLILFVLLACSLVQAAPAWKTELSSPAIGPFPKLTPAVLDLQVSWNGKINAGSVRLEFNPPDLKKRGRFVVRSFGASRGVGAVLFPYQTHSLSELDPATLRPRAVHSVEKDNKETVNTTIRYFPKSVQSREVRKQLKSGKTRQTDRTFMFAPVFDIFSAMLHVRSQKLNAGDQVTLVVQPFDSPYLLRVKVVGREVHNGRNSIRLSIGMQKIDRKTLGIQPYKKLKKDATLWLSDDAERIPLELRAAVFIGDVRATLVSHRKF
jgi:hypothetical protein